jgi:hypothetical protein
MKMTEEKTLELIKQIDEIQFPCLFIPININNEYNFDEACYTDCKIRTSGHYFKIKIKLMDKQLQTVYVPNKGLNLIGDTYDLFDIGDVTEQSGYFFTPSELEEQKAKWLEERFAKYTGAESILKSVCEIMGINGSLEAMENEALWNPALVAMKEYAAQKAKELQSK